MSLNIYIHKTCSFELVCIMVTSFCKTNELLQENTPTKALRLLVHKITFEIKITLNYWE